MINKKQDTDSLIEKINILRKEKNAVILAHYYVDSEIQDIADFTGDSLALSQQVSKTTADIIVFAGVHFMAETAKILCPEKKVLLPDLNSGCSLADSCPDDEFEKFINENPGHIVISYVNTTAKVKALTDIVCTSSNAEQIVKSIPEGKKIIFGPDKNLGNYISKVTDREMLIWNGACHVHNEFSLEGILELKEKNPFAKIISHPECPKPILTVSDFVGSTKALIDFSISDNSSEFIVATEPGVLHQMKKLSPFKTFFAAPGNTGECACNECEFMKLNSLEKIYNCLLNETNEIILDSEIIVKARVSIDKMLEISAKFNL
jgi:quinolinate synthase